MMIDHPDLMTVQWLRDHLGDAASGVTGFSFAPVGTGQMGDSYRLHLEGSSGLQSVIAKCSSHDANSRHAAKLFHCYELEVRWYQAFSHAAQVRTPHCYMAEVHPDTDRCVMLLEDVSPAVQGDQLAGASVEQVRLGLDELARLHAFKWDDPQLQTLDWLNYGEGSREFIRNFVPQVYPEWRARYTGRIAEDILEMGAELARRFDAYLEDRPAPRCLTHGDCRLDNILYADPSGRAILVDWQTVSNGIAMNDVAYMIGTSFSDPEMRRQNEAALVDHYLAELRAQGVSEFPHAQDFYRLGAFSGFVMAINAAMVVERTERGDEMFAVMAERSGAQALALDSLAAL